MIRLPRPDNKSIRIEPHSGFSFWTCRAGNRAVYFGLSHEDLKNIDSKKRGPVHIGDAPVYEMKNWAHRRLFPEGIQYQMRRAEKQDVKVRHLDSPPGDMGPLWDCLSAWLRKKKMPPLGFATDPFLLDPWPRHGIFVAERRDRICGFLISSRSPILNVSHVDVIARAPDAPNGCAEFLVATAFFNLSMLGFEQATLGLAPLSRRSSSAYFESPVWFRILSGCVRHLASPLYSFAGLETFKAKFKPDSWQPLYAVSQEGSFTPRDLLAVLRAFAGGSLLKYAGRALMWRMGHQPLNNPAQ